MDAQAQAQAGEWMAPMVGDHVHVPDPDNPVQVQIVPHAPGGNQLQRQNTEVSRAEYDRLLSEKLNQDRRLERLERQMTASTNAPPQYSTMTKTTIPVPTLEKGMSWMEYKFNVNIWKQGRPVQPEQMGWCLLNALPKGDDRCLKQRIVAAIGLEALGEEDGADKVINELGELIRNPTFVRLVEWDYAWANLKQGAKTFDGFVTKVRELVKESEEEFNLNIPKGLVAAKLLAGCSQLTPDNIGVITQGMDIIKEGQDASTDIARKVEAAIRRHVSTVKVFSDKPGSSNRISHVGYTGRTDVMGIPLSPDKDEDLRNKIRRNSEDNEEVYAASGQYRGRGGGKAGSKAEDSKKARLRAEGKCFECESTEHLSFACPKREARLEKRKREVEAEGGVWRGGKPPKINKVNYTKRVEAQGINLHIEDDELCFTDDEEEETPRTWKSYFTSSPDLGDGNANDDLREAFADLTSDSEEGKLDLDVGEEPINAWKSYMAKSGEGMVDLNRPQNVHFTAEQSDHALLDTGCQKACAGQTWYDNYRSNLSEEELAMILEQPGSSAYKFGGHGVYKSKRLVIAPVYVGGMRRIIKFDIVDTEIPLLISLKMMKRMNMSILCRDKDIDMARIKDTTFRLHHSEGHLYISLSKKGSKASIIRQEEPGNNNLILLATGDIFTKGKEVEEIRKIHVGAGHAPIHKMRLLLREAGQWTDTVKELVKGVIKDCPVKKCREAGEIQKKDPYAAIRLVREPGDLVSVDLKIRSGSGEQDILYAVDCATSFCVAGLIENKTSEEVATKLFKIWYGNNFPRIKTCLSDNGSEFIGQAFRKMISLFNTRNIRTVPYHPASNGQVERVHCVVDGIMQRLMEGNPSLDAETALMWATSAYNQATMTTGFSPAQLMFGVTNSDVSVQDYDVMDLQEMACDKTYRFMEDFQVRREAREAHLVVKNSQKLKQVLLRKSNPTVENKPIGSYVWVKRNGEWIGLGRVCHSLGSEAGVKMAKGWLTCKMGDLMRLNHSELVKHGLGGQEHEEIRDVEDEREKEEERQEDIVTEMEYLYNNPTVPDYIHPDSHDNSPSDSDQESLSSSDSSNQARQDLSLEQRVTDEWVRLLNRGEVLNTDRGPNTSDSEESNNDDMVERQGSAASQQTARQQTETQTLERAASLPQLPQLQPPGSPVPRADSEGNMTRPKRARRNPTTPQSRPLPATPRSPRSPASPGSQPATKKSVTNSTAPRYVSPDASTNIDTIDVIRNPRAKGEVLEILNKATKTFEPVRIMNGSRKPASRSCYKVRTENGKVTWRDLHKEVWREAHQDGESSHEEEDGMDISNIALTSKGKTHEVFHTQIPYWEHKQPLVLKAKEKEMNSHEQFGTFLEVQTSDLSAKDLDLVLPSTWSIVYKGDPKDGIVKARLCVRGDKEKGVENLRTDSPTANAESTRLLLSFAASTELKINSLDFSSAFCQGKDIDRTVFLRPPPDIRAKKPGMVWRVVKRLYGFKDASRGWMQALDEDLKKNGMIRSHYDKGFYTYHENNKLAGMLVVHVDDLLFAGPASMYNQIIKPLKKKYVVGAEDSGVFTFTGWNLRQDRTGILLSQDSYMDKTNLEEFEHFKRYVLNDKESLDDKDTSDYRSLNGILGWIAGTSKPQLAYHYSSTSAKLNRATKGDAKFLYRVLEKAKADRTCIKYSNLGPVQDWRYEIFVDASPGKSRVYDSYTGEICFLTSKKGLRNVISWKSSKLDIPVATPLEAEAEALLMAHSKLKNFKYFFNETFNIDIAADLYTDSKSLHSHTNSDNSAQKSRKIAVAVITARKLMEEDGNTRLRFTEGAKNPADIMTKGTANPELVTELLQTGRSKIMTGTRN